MTSHIHQKALASIVNVLIVLIASLPIYLHSELEVWKQCTVILFFLYNLIFRHRCIGMMIAGTFLPQPANLSYVTLYTASFCTLFYHWHIPCDLLLINAIGCQIPCVVLTGNTLHGYLSGQSTNRNDLSQWDGDTPTAPATRFPVNSG